MIPRGGWQVQFLEADLRTPLPPEADLHRPRQDPTAGQAGRGSERFREPGRCWSTRIETGRGGVYLRLTPEQYGKLRRAVC